MTSVPYPFSEGVVDRLKQLADLLETNGQSEAAFQLECAALDGQGNREHGLESVEEAMRKIDPERNEQAGFIHRCLQDFLTSETGASL